MWATGIQKIKIKRKKERERRRINLSPDIFRLTHSKLNKFFYKHKSINDQILSYTHTCASIYLYKQYVDVWKYANTIQWILIFVLFSLQKCFGKILLLFFFLFFFFFFFLLLLMCIWSFPNWVRKPASEWMSVCFLCADSLVVYNGIKINFCFNKMLKMNNTNVEHTTLYTSSGWEVN